MCSTPIVFLDQAGHKGSGRPHTTQLLPLKRVFIPVLKRTGRKIRDAFGGLTRKPSSPRWSPSQHGIAS